MINIWFDITVVQYLHFRILKLPLWMELDELLWFKTRSRGQLKTCSLHNANYIYIYIIIYIYTLYIIIYNTYIYIYILDKDTDWFKAIVSQNLLELTQGGKHCNIFLQPIDPVGWRDAKPIWSRNLSMKCLQYPLVNSHIAMERSTMFNGKIHYFYGHFQ